MHGLTSWSIRRPVWVLLISVLFATWCVSRTAHLPTSIGVESALGLHHERIQAFHDFIDRFGAGQAVLVAWGCGGVVGCESVLDPVSLRMVAEVGRMLEPSPGVIRVASPANTPLLVPDPGHGFSRRWLIEDGRIARDHQVLAGLALDDPSWVGRLVARDGRTGVLVVETASSETAAMLSAVHAIDDALAIMRAKGFEAHAIGQPVIEDALATGAARDGSVLGAAVAIILASVIYALTRTWVAVLCVLAAVGVGALASFGWMDVAGYPRDPISAAAPMLVMVIGSASGLHLFCSYLEFRARGVPRREGLRAATRKQALPCLLATVTTAGALLSYTAADLSALVRLGTIMTAGVCAAFVACFSLLPALVCLLPEVSLAARETPRRWQPGLRALGRVTRRHARVIAWAAAVLSLFSIWGATRLAVGGDGKTYLHAGHPVRVADRFVSTLVRPSDALEVEVSLAEGRSIADPGVLAALERIEARLAAPEWLGAPDSVLVPLRQLHVLVRDEQRQGTALPVDDAKLASELLLLLSMGDPGSAEALLTVDHRRVRFSVPVHATHSASRSDLLALERRLREELPPGASLLVTGPLALAQFQLDLTVSSMATSLMLAVSFVFLALWATLRSLRWALLAMVPNLWPLLILLGSMGWLGIPFDAASASVGTMALGLAVDDTLHLLVAFRRRRSGGRAAAHAMSLAIEDVGRAVVTTSLAFGLGFLALLPSAFAGVANMGLLSSLAVFAALGADLLLFPALVHLGLGGPPIRSPRADRAAWTAHECGRRAHESA